MNPLELKLLAVFLIFAAALFGTALAHRSAAAQRHAQVFALGNAFAAGIFLGAALIHLLPDAVDEFASAVHTDFPLAGFFAVMGFLLILGIEKVLLSGHEGFGAERTDLTLYPYALVLILSVHSVIAGIALGTETDVQHIIVILIAILAHKSSAAFALTVSMISAQIALRRIRALTRLFAFTTPAGIAAGTVLALNFDATASELLIALFDALAAGTFLYIAIMEILNDAFSDRRFPGLKMLAAVAGALLMALLAVWL
jgi:solute carrier family 39 (zinc transporter), member 1/2/3